MESTKIGVFEHGYNECLRGLLHGEDGLSLEPEVCLEILSDLAHKALERHFLDQKLSAFLVPAYFADCNGAWTITIASGFFLAPRILGGKVDMGLLSRTLSLAGLLLRTSHV